MAKAIEVKASAWTVCGAIALVLVLAQSAIVFAQGSGASPAVVPPKVAPAFTREADTDRSGNDINVVTLDVNADADACEKLCRETKSCVSFTFVKRSTTVPQPVCRLKDQEPFGHKSSCCVSGALQR